MQSVDYYLIRKVFMNDKNGDRKYRFSYKYHIKYKIVINIAIKIPITIINAFYFLN